MNYAEWKENTSKCAEVLKGIRDKWEDGETVFQICNVLNNMAGCVGSATDLLEWINTTAEEETGGDAKILRDKLAEGPLEVLKEMAEMENEERYIAEKRLQESEEAPE